MGAIVQRIKDWWEGADRTQRTVTIFGAAILALLMGLTFHFATAPRFQPVYSGLTAKDQGAVVDELNALGVPVQIGTQGTVLVPSDRIDEVKMRLAASGKTPNSGSKGLELLDGINSFNTPAQEREKIIAAIEGELENSILKFAGVSQATVHIALGKDSPFQDEVVPPTASVNIVEQSMGSVSSDQAIAIARLVQSKVTGLKSSGVNVIASGRLIYDGDQQGSSESIASRKIEAEVEESKRRERDLQRRLDVAFGPGNTVAMVQVELDMDSVSQHEKILEFGDKKVAQKSTETMTDGSGNTVGGAAGLDSNTPSAPTAVDIPKSAKYSSEVVSNQYPSTETSRELKKSPGKLIAMTVSVIANNTAIKDVAPVQSIVDSYLGDRKGTPGFAGSVQAVSFDTSMKDLEKKALADSAAKAQVQQIISLLPIAALVFVGFMVTKALGKIPGKTLTMALPAGGTMQVPSGNPQQDEISGILERSPNSGNTRTVAELARTEPEIAEALQQMGVESIDDSVDVEAIRARIDVPLEQIKKMARQKPQAIALLIKGWLMEERK
ncbi:MAG: flagellar M-ring protein FliF [Fimbriimonadaceae bacterium]|nr:flagellar M-ring protein FliF [Fimbriimonadaceae bacterium]QYK54706.1 MAG: flagellar M-ring protein FliF [Fimbriimonadaceae bacterium]